MEMLILLAGGKDKGGSYKVIADQMKKVRAYPLIGEAKERINEMGGGLLGYLHGE